MIDNAPHLHNGPGNPIVLDGGMSNALEGRGHDLSDALWTARLLNDAPEEIAAVHRRYFAAGADVATTASYQASIAGWQAYGMTRSEAEKLITGSVVVARRVRDELADDGRRRWVAASVGPYGAVRADGSEYRGRYGLSTAALREFHLPRIELLASAEPDFLAVETIPDLQEAEVLATILDELRIPAWVSFTIDGLQLRDGNKLSDALRVAAAPPSVFAVGVNCCDPADVSAAVELVGPETARPAVCYPNSGQRWDGVRHRWHGPSGFDPQLAADWAAAGASYIGGCCRVGADEIAAIRDRLSCPRDGR